MQAEHDAQRVEHPAKPQSGGSEERTDDGLSASAACSTAVGAPQAGSTPGRYFHDHEFDEDVPCPKCSAPLVRKTSTAIGAMWVCGCGASWFAEELVNAWPENAGVFL